MYLILAKLDVDMVVTREGKRREKLGGGRGKCRDFGGRITVGLDLWVLCVVGGVICFLQIAMGRYLSDTRCIDM